jgi:hypothetical protein
VVVIVVKGKAIFLVAGALAALSVSGCQRERSEAKQPVDRDERPELARTVDATVFDYVTDSVNGMRRVLVRLIIPENQEANNVRATLVKAVRDAQRHDSTANAVRVMAYIQQVDAKQKVNMLLAAQEDWAGPGGFEHPQPSDRNALHRSTFIFSPPATTPRKAQ